MSALAEVTAAGGRVWAEGDKLRYRVPKGRADLVEVLREHKAELMAELKAKGETLAPEIQAAYARLKHELSEHPTLKTALEVLDPDTDPVLLAIAVRGAGYAVLRMPRANYDGFKLLELVHRWNVA